MTVRCVDTSTLRGDPSIDLGTPPEDEPGTEGGAPEAPVSRDGSGPSSSPRDRVSLASRIDAMMETADRENAEDEEAERASSSEISVDLTDVIEEDTPRPRPPVPALPPPPVPRVAIPPRPPPGVVRVPPLGKPPAIPQKSGPIPTVAIPPPSVPAIPRPSNGDMTAKEGSGPVVAPPSSDSGRHEPSATDAPAPRLRTPTGPPPADVGPDPTSGADAALADGGGGVEVGVETPSIAVEQPLEASLEHPTVIDRALEEIGDAGSEKRAETVARDLENTTDNNAAAYLAYELGELYERRLADEARAVKSYGRALTLDPALRPNLWAIRRVFYRRGLWPNLAKLIGAEVEFARDDQERADLLLEKARVLSGQINDTDEARAALDEAVRIAPTHQGALLELERMLAKAGDTPALLDVWELLADAVQFPPRKIAYWLEVARAAGAREYPRAQAAFEHATALAAAGGVPPSVAERIARERLRIAEENGTPEDVTAATDALATLLLHAFGPAGPAGEDQASERANAMRRELVALRRRQAQIARTDAPEKAWDVLQQALALSPGEPLVLADLTELAEELGRYEDLAELVQSWQAVEGDPSRAMALSIRRADALLRGGQHDQARALLASLEASAPGFIVLASAAERDALGRAEPQDLAKAYITAAQAAQLGTWLGPGPAPQPDPGAAAALYVQAAELLAYEVGGPEAFDEARSALGKALEAMPDHPAALEALTELDDTTGNIAAALERLRATADKTPDGDGKRALLERAVRLARSHGDLEAVLVVERQLSAAAPADLNLRWRMESTLAQLGRDEDRAVLLAEIATVEPDATRRGTALLAAARLRERSGAVEAATDLYRQVLTLWPEDAFARESLIDLLRAQERWPELVTERRAEARVLPDGPAARRALREAAWVLEVRIGDLASAAVVYEEWLQRFDDDRTALEGAARTRAQFGDRNGEVLARKAIAELDPSAEAQWLYGRALERAGQFDEAADVFRALATRPEPSVASTSAALGLADLAAGRADTVMRLEATSALAMRTTDPRLGAALAEDSGWMYALVLEDFDRAAQAFEAANSADPSRKGALLGAALVAARRSDPMAQSAAYDSLAASVQMPEAAAALHMRAAAMAAANGDADLANQRVAAARGASPDDVSALLVLAEASAIPNLGTNSEDKQAIIEPLLARAEVLELRTALADDPAQQASWELDRAEALELAGRLREAGTVVAGVLKTLPNDLRGLEALRRLAKRAGDDATWAQASYQLARAIGDPPARVALLRDAAGVFDRGKVPNPELALAAYRRIIEVERGAPELERLLELLRERADVKGLIRSISERLTWLEAQEDGASQVSAAEMVPLLLERATVMHGLGDKDAAMSDLDALLDRAASHVEALRFRADLAFNAGDVERAVQLWRRAVQHETRPARRKEIELQLAQVLAENVNDIAGAIENLEHVAESSPDDVGLRERLLALAIRASDWDRCTRDLRHLAKLRATPQEKARDELRLGLMLRDKQGDRVAARLALDRARGHDPLNLDVVRELSELLEPTARASMLAATANSFRASIVQNPKSAALYERLAQVTGWQSDVDARWLALVGVETLGTPSVDQRQVLAQGRQKLGAPARIKLDEAARALLRGGSSLGPLADLWRAVAPAVQVATAVDPAKLGFVRGDRIAVKKLGEKYEPLAAALACFGLEEVEVYVGAQRVGMARALAAETPILCIGADVAAAAMPQHRFQLGRAVATLAEGLATLPDLREGELEWSFVAALRALELPIPEGLREHLADDATLAERAKIMKKELSRKQKAQVIELVKARAPELNGVADFRRRAIALGNRAGLVWSGDLAVAHAQLDVGKGGKALADHPSALELTAWSISEEHAKLRDRLGVALKGTR